MIDSYTLPLEVDMIRERLETFGPEPELYFVKHKYEDLFLVPSFCEDAFTACFPEAEKRDVYPDTIPVFFTFSSHLYGQRRENQEKIAANVLAHGGHAAVCLGHNCEAELARRGGYGLTCTLPGFYLEMGNKHYLFVAVDKDAPEESVPLVLDVFERDPNLCAFLTALDIPLTSA